MLDISELLISNLNEAKEKIDIKVNDITPRYENRKLSKNLLRMPLNRNNENSINVHLQALSTQLNNILINDVTHLKTESIYLEFSKGITLFDSLTGAIEMKGGTYGDNFIASQNFYLDAIASYKNNVPSFYQGDLNISYIPVKLRLAIEVYFKNMIGYIEARKTHLKGKYKDRVDNYPLSISEILRFLLQKKYKKYSKLPIDINIVRDINYWSNHLVHTGVISFPWQSLTAVDLLNPLFYTKHKNESIHMEGFNYLNLNYKQEDFVKDLNAFLSSEYVSIQVITSDRKKKPIEGAYYYPKHKSGKG